MTLSTRLVLLILGCMLPILGAQIYTQISVHSERETQVGRLTLHQAELAASDMGSIIEGVTQLSVAIGQFPAVEGEDLACSHKLSALQHALPSYKFLAIADPTGRLECASAPVLTQPTHASPVWLSDLLAGSGTAVGQVATEPGIDGPFLPIAVPMPPSGHAPGPECYVIAALDLQWLARHLVETRQDHSPLIAKGTLTLTDRDGVVLAAYPGNGQIIGHALTDSMKALVVARMPGVTTLTGRNGQPQLVAYVPASAAPFGVAAIETLPSADIAADQKRADEWGLFVAGGAVLAALILAWAAGRRFIYQPTEALLQAAQRWRDGDLTARATPSETGSEFAALAQSFNAMAAALQTRELERRLQAQFQEAQVRERTRELSEANNRLLVEIAEREKTEAALHQAQKLQAVGELAGGIAHDFNNLLATVLGNLELMERRVPTTTANWTADDAKKLTRLIDRATGAVQRGAQLTSRLLAFLRRQKLTVRPTNLNKLVTELITLASSTLGRRVRVIPDLATDLWAAQVDPSQVEAAILNLCLNARDAMKDGGQLTISTANEILVDRQSPDDPPPGSYVRVSIADTGIGMTPDVRQRAFDPFFTTKPHGSGLGLSQVYGMARQSGGTVRIESTPGVGTEVSLLLPRATAPVESDAVEPDGDCEPKKRPEPTELVLVVDDDNAVRQVTVEMLRDLGMKVLEAPGGSEALAMVKHMTEFPRLILLDYLMPEMNGLQLARCLRDRGLNAPIALVTGYAELTEADAKAGPLDGLLRKPFTIRELQSLVEQLRASRSERNGVATRHVAVWEDAASPRG